MINILIAEDILILRQGLKAVLEQDSELLVTGMASNGLEAYELCKETLPDIVLMDMCMPEYDGAFGIRKIKAEFPDLPVLVLTALCQLIHNILVKFCIKKFSENNFLVIGFCAQKGHKLPLSNHCHLHKLVLRQSDDFFQLLVCFL